MVLEVPDVPVGSRISIIRPKNRLPDTPFSQQKLPGWQPVVNIGTVWLPLFIIGVAFILGGSLILYASIQPTEVRVTYSSPDTKDCRNCINEVKASKGPCQSCSSPSNKDPCQCSVKFDVEEALNLPVYMYYEIENFHQSHRRYVKSRDDYQLLGRIGKPGDPIEPSSHCAPFATESNTKKFYFPCGAMANSMFSDTLIIKDAGKTVVPLSSDNTTWSTELNYKFRNPVGVKNLEDFKRKDFGKHFVKPKDWSDEFWTEWWKEGGLENRKFINWMHPAPNPTFRKLYGIIKNDADLPRCRKKGLLCKGQYYLDVTYRFDVDRFNGKKHVILAQASFLGTENRFIGVFPIFVGITALLIGCVFFFINKRHKSRVHPGHRRFSVNPNQMPPLQPALLVQPEPSTSETKPSTAHPRASTAKGQHRARSSTVQLQPKPSTSESKSSMADPRSSTAQPRPSTANPTPSTVQPEPSTSESKPSTSKSTYSFHGVQPRSSNSKSLQKAHVVPQNNQQE